MNTNPSRRRLPKVQWPVGSVPMKFTAPHDLYQDIQAELEVSFGQDMHDVLAGLLRDGLSAREQARKKSARKVL